jgi:uncharacterized coiled-coil DUF342 family protein
MMATGPLDPFLKAEEEANFLVEQLKRLKEEVESYRTAREALSKAAEAVSKVSTRCASIAERLGGLAEALRSIGTAELLQGLQEIAEEVRMLRQDLDSTRQSTIELHKGSFERLQKLISERSGWASDAAKNITELRKTMAGITAEVRVLRNLAFGSIALLVMALVLLGWIVLSRVGS